VSTVQKTELESFLMLMTVSLQLASATALMIVLLGCTDVVLST
jgi:hypothetical protein